MNYLEIAFQSIFSENTVLALFLGLCPFLAQSKRMDTSIGLGGAVFIVMALASPLNWLLWHYLLKPQALHAESDLSFLRFIVFIATIAALVQVLEKAINRFIPPLYHRLGIYLPLITVNCAVLGASLFTVERNYNFPESLVFGASAGAGWAVACIILAAVRHKIKASNVPEGLRGAGIAFILTGLMAMAFSAFSGLVAR